MPPFPHLGHSEFPNLIASHRQTAMAKSCHMSYSFGYQTGRRTGLALWGKLSLSGKGLGQGFLNVAEMMVLVVFLDSIVF